MVPRAGWACDTKDQAPVVYRNKNVIVQQEFGLERQRLVGDAAILKSYVQWLLDSQPALAMELHKVVRNAGGGQVLVNFSTLIPRLPKVDIYAFAEEQIPVVTDFAEKLPTIRSSWNFTIAMWKARRSGKGWHAGAHRFWPASYAPLPFKVFLNITRSRPSPE